MDVLLIFLKPSIQFQEIHCFVNLQTRKSVETFINLSETCIQIQNFDLKKDDKLGP